MARFIPHLLLAALCGLCSTTFTVVASGQPEPSAKEVSEDSRAKALALFEESENLYRDGKFAEAAAKLEEAYQLHQEPILLYNLGRARDGNGEFDAAVTAYRSYLDSAEEIPDRGAIERRIQTLEDRIAEEQRLEQDRAQANQRLTEMERREQERPPAESEGSVLTGLMAWALLGVGLAGVAVGGVLGAMASAKHHDAAAEPVQVDAADRQGEAEDLAMGANLAFIAGGALAVAGGTLTIIGLVGSEEPEATAYHHRPIVVGASWRTAF